MTTNSEIEVLCYFLFVFISNIKREFATTNPLTESFEVTVYKFELTQFELTQFELTLFTSFKGVFS